MHTHNAAYECCRWDVHSDEDEKGTALVPAMLLAGHSAPISLLYFVSRELGLLVSVDAAGTACLWEAATGLCRYILAVVQFSMCHYRTCMCAMTVSCNQSLDTRHGCF